MLLVIDASIALSAALTRDGFEPIKSHDLVAPPLLWSEALSTLREHAWRRDISPQQAEASRRSLLSAPVERRAPRALYGEAWRVAEELGWAKTYDAEYVALARLLRCPLLTRDDRLRHGAARVIEAIGPTEL
ncbi:MAG: type II toxin-antitoxin system VapC family toxin [Chloroflexota bacterium]|nr:type II toxin-antitoxin system VapC family toxin [Chloroflexota bacterium]